MISRCRRWLAVAGAVAMLALPGSAAVAQSTPMRFIVGLAPGGAVDPYAPHHRRPHGQALGRTIIIDNRPGAGGNISAQVMTDASGRWHADLGRHASAHRDQPSVYSNLRWSIDDFLPLIKGVQAPLVLVAHPSVPASNFAEFVAWAKANRGKLTLFLVHGWHAVAPSGFSAQRKVRSRSHPCSVSRLGIAGDRPYRRAFAARFCAGQFFGIAICRRPAQGIRHHQCRALAGHEGRPDLAELGQPELTDPGVVQPVVKQGTPADIVARLTDAAKAAHADPAVRSKLEAQGYEVTGETGPQLMPDIKAQTARWARIVKAAGFSAEDRGSTR